MNIKWHVVCVVHDKPESDCRRNVFPDENHSFRTWWERRTGSCRLWCRFELDRSLIRAACLINWIRLFRVHRSIRSSRWVIEPISDTFHSPGRQAQTYLIRMQCCCLPFAVRVHSSFALQPHNIHELLCRTLSGRSRSNAVSFLFFLFIFWFFC